MEIFGMNIVPLLFTVGGSFSAAGITFLLVGESRIGSWNSSFGLFVVTTALCVHLFQLNPTNGEGAFLVMAELAALAQFIFFTIRMLKTKGGSESG